MAVFSRKASMSSLLDANIKAELTDKASAGCSSNPTSSSASSLSSSTSSSASHSPPESSSSPHSAVASSSPSSSSSSPSSSSLSPVSSTTTTTAAPVPTLPPPTSSAPLLPPCRVCGEKASGFHYGANTCEACKGFFRRSLARKANYRCAGSENCEIEPGKRSICAYCRYQKCLAIGMSKDAIKTGRYTHEKKTRDIEEVKRLQNRQAAARIKPPSPKDSLLPRQPSPARTGASSAPAAAAASAAAASTAAAAASEREAELERIIKHITAAHLEQTPHSPEFFKKLPEKEAEYWEKRALQEQMFGPMKPIPREDYQQIYNSTGIDIDGRREMIAQIIPCIERAIKRFISFAKALPGFKELPIEDQIALIKGSRFDYWFLTQYRGFNVEHQLYTFPRESADQTIDIHRWSTIYDLSFLQDLFRAVQRIQKMYLLPSEIAILKAIAVFSPDRCWSAEGARQVERIQGALINILRYQFEKNHPYMRNMMAKAIAVLAQLRTLEVQNHPNIERIYRDFQSLEVPAIGLELHDLI